MADVVCEDCGAPDAMPRADGRLLCDTCAAGLPLTVSGVVVADEGDRQPAVLIGGEWWTWDELGQALAETLLGGRAVRVHLAGQADVSTADLADLADLDEAGVFASNPSSDLAFHGENDRPRARLFDDRRSSPDPPDGGAFEEDQLPDQAEAVALLADCLPREVRLPRPDAALAAACGRLRAEAAAGTPGVRVLAGAAGWSDDLPADDEQLWLDAVGCFFSVHPPESLDRDLLERLDAMEPDDWLATVIELTRAGPRTPADPGSLVALSARCLDVDSSAVDPRGAAVLGRVFEAIVPFWAATGVLDGDGMLTELGAWGLAPALARAWGGTLEEGVPLAGGPPAD